MTKSLTSIDSIHKRTSVTDDYRIQLDGEASDKVDVNICSTVGNVDSKIYLSGRDAGNVSIFLIAAESVCAIVVSLAPRP